MNKKSDIFYTEQQYRDILKRAEGASESNCGPIPCLTFDEQDQYVDVSPGSGHEFVAPGIFDLLNPISYRLTFE